MSNQQFSINQEVEWLTRPIPGSYLHGIIFKIGTQKVGIIVKSRTGEEKRKWAEPRYLRAVNE